MTGLISILLVLRRVVPTLVCGLLLAIQDARTHTVLPAHILEGLSAQVLWYVAMGRTDGTNHEEMYKEVADRIGIPLGIALLAAMLVWCASSLPGRPIGDGDALTTLLFAFALSATPTSGILQEAVLVLEWSILSAVCAGLLLIIGDFAPHRPRAPATACQRETAFVPAQYAGFVLTVALSCRPGCILPAG